MSATITDLTTTRLSRRAAMRALAGAGLAALALTTAGSALAEHTAQQYTVSVNANFRAGPGTGYGVISVIPQGATFAINGTTQNDFASITYQGRQGWVYASFVVPAGGFDPVIVGNARTTTSVNLRTEPSTSTQVLRVVAANTWVEVSDTVQNGFRYVVHDGLAGWIYATYLDRPTDQGDQGGNTATTTTALNLRAEPSTSARILTVMPAGATVELGHVQAGSFAEVRYNGLQGWAHLDYLR